MFKSPLFFRGRAGRERTVAAILTKLEKALRRGGASPRDTFPLRVRLARVLARAAAPPGGYRGGEGGEFAGAVFPDGGADVFMPAELLDGFYAAGFPLPPGAEVGDLLHVLCHSWEGAVLRISLLAEALAAGRFGYAEACRAADLLEEAAHRVRCAANSLFVSAGRARGGSGRQA